MMVPKDGDEVKVGRKRSKQQQPTTPTKQHVAERPAPLDLDALPKAAANSVDARRWAASPSSRGSSPDPVGDDNSFGLDAGAGTPLFGTSDPITQAIEGFTGLDNMTLGDGLLSPEGEKPADKARAFRPATRAHGAANLTAFFACAGITTGGGGRRQHSCYTSARRRLEMERHASAAGGFLRDERAPPPRVLPP